MLHEKEFFNRINAEIVCRYKTMKTFADAVGIPNTTLYTILHQTRRNASFDTIVRICDALEISIDTYRSETVAELEQRELYDHYLALPDMRPAVRKLLEIEPKD